MAIWRHTSCLIYSRESFRLKDTDKNADWNWNSTLSDLGRLPVTCRKKRPWTEDDHYPFEYLGIIPQTAFDKCIWCRICRSLADSSPTMVQMAHELGLTGAKGLLCLLVEPGTENVTHVVTRDQCNLSVHLISASHASISLVCQSPFSLSSGNKESKWATQLQSVS